MTINKKQTVLIITSHYPPNFGGVESHLQALVSGLIKSSWKVLISTYQPLASMVQAPYFENSKGVSVYRFPWLGFNIVHKLTHYPLLEFLYLFPGLFIISLFILIKHSDNINVVHSQGLVPTTVGGILAVVFRKRLVSSIHNMYFFPKEGLYTKVASLIFNMADTVLAPTQTAADELISIGVKKEKVKLFRYWLNLSRFIPHNKILAEKQLNFKGFTVLFVGRLIETKGIKIIVKMLDKLNKHINVMIAGDGPSRTYLEQAAKKNRNLTYLGRIENDRLPLYYSAADLLIVPSIVDEGWGFVAMEAISCGTPVVASKKGGLSDVVSSLVGKLVTPNSVSFSNIINSLYKKPEELKILRSGCRKYAVKNFGEKNIQGIIEHYQYEK
ncbi:hypothetical protein A3C32_04390 [Candidatus Daviesbacteria bacterium RIFCSPHIGHO2_02_FULL_41_14]|uniref:Glycosyltransferase subfamily 4-like N-terminal domain-containing protein n=1 Tax=Candidatus Daviesbacteria bacterium RIFCSPLOWO2_01_FULL_40_24 TaxID=1797787 RepID=A0A1F5MJA9_9BACT|nr:MAG: hypothetical protein A3C32_04390 [Candidatus Daviesbacteria bacterium RIFCSPHIGHO2_02_FULL_41_14]OGE65466.1 MAG: hypothetical protein A3B49_01085 [Candidatus Daviesbacteria bacterium RIFCSPLOWO2_01_FULL_40_24]